MQVCWSTTDEQSRNNSSSTPDMLPVCSGERMVSSPTETAFEKTAFRLTGWKRWA